MWYADDRSTEQKKQNIITQIPKGLDVIFLILLTYVFCLCQLFFADDDVYKFSIFEID